MSARKLKRKAKDTSQPSGADDRALEETPPASDDGDAARADEVEPIDEPTRLRQDAKQWQDKFLRAKAEQQNALKRAANEQQELIRYANTQVLRSLVDVADDLNRTIEAAGQCESIEAVVDGVKLVQKKIEKLLVDHFVVRIEACEGKTFDPTRHEALMQQPSGDYEPGTVIQEVQAGYMLRERVLRPAKVIVSSAAIGEQTDQES